MPAEIYNVSGTLPSLPPGCKRYRQDSRSLFQASHGDTCGFKGCLEMSSCRFVWFGGLAAILLAFGTFKASEIALRISEHRPGDEADAQGRAVGGKAHHPKGHGLLCGSARWFAPKADASRKWTTSPFKNI